MLTVSLSLDRYLSPAQQLNLPVWEESQQPCFIFGK